MSPRARKVVKGLVVFLAASILLGAVALHFLVSTPAGARWAFGRLGALMKGTVKADSVEGRLRSPLTIHGLTYETESVRVTVETVSLRWDLARLLRRQLDIVSLTADGVVFAAKPQEEKASKGLTDIHLPINILVRQATVTRIRIGDEPKSAIIADSISLATVTIGDALKIDRLSIRAPLFDGDFEGSVTPIGDYPISLDMRWRYRPPGSPEYKGHGAMRGTLAELTVTQKVEAPFLATVEAVMKEPFRDASLDLTATFAEVRTRAINADWPDLRLDGEIKASGSLDSVHLDARVATVSEMLQKADLVFSGDYAKGAWKIARLEVTRPGTPMVLSASGNVTPPGPGKPPEALAVDLDASWRELSWPLAGPPSLASHDGTARITGTLDDYAIEANAEISGGQIPEGRWTLRGRGDRKHLDLATLDGTILRGRLQGSGQVAWSPEVAWNVTARGTDLDPSARWAGYDGRLSFQLATHGRMAKQGPEAHVEVASAAGTFRQQSFTATAVVDLAGEAIRVSKFDLRSGPSHLTAEGIVGARSDFTFDLDAPALSALVPGVAGSLSGSGRITGSRATPRVRATVHGKALAQADRSVASLTATADVDLSRDGPMNVVVTADGVGIGDRTFTTVRLTAEGTKAHHALALTARSEEPTRPMSLTVALDGGLDAHDEWRGKLSRLDLRSKEAGDWSLGGPAAVTASATEGSLNGFCLTSRGGGGGGLCADGSFGEGFFEVAGRTESLPLAVVRPWLPEDVEITGNVDGTFAAKGARDGTLEARVELAPWTGEIRIPRTGGERQAIGYRDASLRLAAGPAGLTANARVTFTDVGLASFDLTLPRFNDRAIPPKSQPIQGHVVADVTRLDVVQGFVSNLRDVKGELHADLALGGTLGAPTVRGEAALRGGSADVPDLGLKLRDVTVVAHGDGSGPLKFEGSLRSGTGTLVVAGETPVTPGALTATVVKITGDRFLVLDQPIENRVFVSPRLTVTLKGNRVEVEGDLEVPEAKYEWRSAFAAVRVSPDVRIVGKEPALEQPVRSIRARIRLVLGEKVHLKASGFDARIAGSVLVIEEPGRQPIATGELEIFDGTYKAYGQDLKIDRGRLLFGGGPLDNPSVDARAYRKAKDGVVAGIVIKGTLRSPQTNLYSEPPMAQADALAYLLLGHPLKQSTQQEGSLVTNAAASLGLAGGNLLVKQLAAKFGLEEARLETEGSLKEASLVVGQFLSPRLYVQYGIGVFTNVLTLRVSYLLDKRWTLRAETGAANSADILYTIEK